MCSTVIWNMRIPCSILRYIVLKIAYFSKHLKIMNFSYFWPTLQASVKYWVKKHFPLPEQDKRMSHSTAQDRLFLAYRIGESVDLPVHGKPYLSTHHSELLECLPTQYIGEEFRLSPRCMDDFRFSDVT